MFKLLRTIISKKGIGSILFILTIFLCVFGTTGCTKKDKKEVASGNIKEKKVINIWGGEALIGETELEMDQSEWLLTKLIKEYEENNDQLEINYTYIEDDSILYQIFKRSKDIPEEVPDIVILETGNAFLELTSSFYAIDDFISEEDMETQLNWENTKGEDGKIYGYPTGGMLIGLVAYNKALAKELDLDLDNNPPKYFDEFEKMLEYVKKNSDILPIASGDLTYNSLYSNMISKWWLQQSGYKITDEIKSNNYKFEDDKAFLESLEIGQDFYTKGYINLDYATNDSPLSDFINSEALFFPTHNADLKFLYEMLGDDLGVMEIPDYAKGVDVPSLNFGTCCQCFSIVKSTKYPEECYKLLEWLNNRENSIKMNYTYGTLPAKKDVSFTDVGYIEEEVYEDIYHIRDHAKLSVLTFLDQELQQQYFRYGVQTMINQMEPKEFAKILDDEMKSR